MTATSKKRIDAFVDWFIRSEFMQMREFGASSDDWINDPERMDRVQAAAEYGRDGSTHQEHIQDWRDAFQDYIQYQRKNRFHSCELFAAGVIAHFDAVEAWHESHGSLFEQVG